MNLVESLRVALGSLATSKLRSALTMLGIVIGVAAVITLVSLGQGVQKMVTEEIKGAGANLLFIFPGRLQHQGAFTAQSSLTYGDAQALADPLNVPYVTAIAPQLSRSAHVSYADKDLFISVVGVTPEAAPVRNLRVAYGEFIDSNHLHARSRVAVLGSGVVDDLFPQGPYPLGQNIKINGLPFRIIGVLEEKGATAFGSQDDMIWVPLTTAYARLFPQQRNFSGEYLVSTIYAQVASEDHLDAAAEEITRVLRQRHDIDLGDDDDFSVITQADLVAILGEVTGVLTLFLGSIAAISLLVGGIGIMNIMLVSVTERTREIGIRKAVGAKRRDILLQFLVEAVVLSLLGGVVGIALGYLGSNLVSRLSEDL
ncbi:MAG: ABC transporter permease, partial [Anaerolineae bacterium]